MRLRGQHNELVGLGALKKEADAYHFEVSQKLEKDLSKVKKENNRLKTQLQSLREKQKHMLKSSDFERDEAPQAVKKKLKSMVMPIRGGGKKKKRKKKNKGKSKKKNIQAQNDLKGPSQFNNFHAKSPSMMNPGFMPPPQSLIYQPQYDVDQMQGEDILNGEIP